MLIIIDGSSLLSIAFYGTVPTGYHQAKTPEEKARILPELMQTSKGVYTNAVYSMCRTLLYLIEDQQPTHFAVAWDVGRNTFRKAIYPAYKANRPEKPEELKSQFILMQEVLRCAGVKQFMHRFFEADDFLGSLASKFESQIPVRVLTKDQDALQLVTEKTHVWLITSRAFELKKKYPQDSPDGSFEFSPDLVKEVYGITPEQIIEWKALAGDSSDNIPGIKGIGDKVAIPLLQEYGNLKAIFNAVKDETPFRGTCKRLGIRAPIKKLRDGQEDAFLSKKLATIHHPVINAELDDLILDVDKESLSKKLAELEFVSLVKKLYYMAEKSAV